MSDTDFVRRVNEKLVHTRHDTAEGDRRRCRSRREKLDGNCRPFPRPPSVIPIRESTENRRLMEEGRRGEKNGKYKHQEI